MTYDHLIHYIHTVTAYIYTSIHVGAMCGSVRYASVPLIVSSLVVLSSAEKSKIYWAFEQGPQSLEMSQGAR